MPAGKVFSGVEPAGGEGFTMQQELTLAPSAPNSIYTSYNGSHASYLQDNILKGQKCKPN